jgi:hypothetical protein
MTCQALSISSSTTSRSLRSEISQTTLRPTSSFVPCSSPQAGGRHGGFRCIYALWVLIRAPHAPSARGACSCSLISCRVSGQRSRGEPDLAGRRDLRQWRLVRVRVIPYPSWTSPVHGNTVGNTNPVICWRTVAHYGASPEERAGFPGGSSELIMPGSRVRVPPLLFPEAPRSLGDAGPLYLLSRAELAEGNSSSWAQRRICGGKGSSFGLCRARDAGVPPRVTRRFPGIPADQAPCQNTPALHIGTMS